jgi:hypothetical protein
MLNIEVVMELSFALITSFPKIPIKPAECRAVTAELRTSRLHISATPQEHLPLPDANHGSEEHFDLQELTLVFVLLEVFLLAKACSRASWARVSMLGLAGESVRLVEL